MNWKIRLHNIGVWIKDNLGGGPECCGYFRNPDGKMVECSEWLGYQDCMFPGCGHYYIEHSDGTPNKIIYSKDNPEEVGKVFSDPVGCLNAGCYDCPGFWDKTKLHEFIQLLSRARNHAIHSFPTTMGTVETVASINIVVDVNVVMAEGTEREQREAVYAKELELMAKFPGILWDFHVLTERKPSEEIKEAATE